MTHEQRELEEAVVEEQAQGTEAFKEGLYEEAQEKWSAALKRRIKELTDEIARLQGELSAQGL